MTRTVAFVLERTYREKQKIKAMKKITFKLPRTIMLALVSILLIALTSCESSDSSNGDPDLKGSNYKVSKGDYTFYADKEKYTNLEDLRGDSTLCQIEIEIVKVKRQGNSMVIDIAKPKNCDVEFEIVWNGTIMESFPMQGHFYIHPISKNCTDQEEKEVIELTLDLEGILKGFDASYIADTNFTIMDSCKFVDIVCVKNCDVTTTN